MAVTGKKISEFSAGTLPLVGTEIVPILQAGNKRVTAQDVANLAATAPAVQALSPEYAYYKRVLADLGSIKDLNRLTELYMNQLNLLPYTHFMWDGNSGYKVVDGKLTKAYDMSPNANDGTTSAGTEPYAGGLIAPNESVKIKALIAENRNIALTSEFLKSSSDRWSVTFVANIIKTGNISIIFGKNGFGFFGISSSGNFIFYNQSETLYAFSTSALPYINKNTTFSLIGFGSQIGLYINGNLVESKDCVASISISYILNYDNNVNSGAYNFIGHIPYFQAITKSLSAYEIQLQHELLRLQHPEIEGIDIGNQHWATSNYEGVVTGNGTVIPEYQYTAANSPELVVNGDFATSDNWGFEEPATTSIAGSSLVFNNTTNDYTAFQAIASAVIGKYYKVTYTIVSISSGSIKATFGAIGTERNSEGTFAEIIRCDNTTLRFRPVGTTTAVIDNVSVKEVGWADLTIPAWCYYNNDPALGAVYGKLYNYEAVKAIAANPPSGWRVPTIADVYQVRDYLGSGPVAGMKMKAKYGGFNDAFATNESGFSFADGGIRNADGSFVALTSIGMLRTSDGNIYYLVPGESTLYTAVDVSVRGAYLRLLRNSPVGDDTRIVSTGRFATDISGSQKFIPIPFGYEVETVVINSSNNLTGVSAWIINSGWSWSDQIFSNKSVDANITKQLRISTDNRVLQQDGFVIVLATGNTGDGMTIDVVLKKIQ